MHAVAAAVNSYCSNSVLSSKYFSTSYVPYLWGFLPSLSQRSLNLLGFGGWGDVPPRAEHSTQHCTVSYCLHRQHLWISVLITSWGLRVMLTYGYEDENSGGSLVLCPFTRIIIYKIHPYGLWPKQSRILPHRQYQAWVVSHGISFKSNQRVIGYCYNIGVTSGCVLADRSP